MTADQYCEQKVRQSGSSFYYSFLFLEPQQRQAMVALYAFCREIDDIVDSPTTKNHNSSVAYAKLQWWKTEISHSFTHTANHPIAKAISQSLKHYAFELEYFVDIINGMEMDLQHQGFETMDDLNSYCYHVAGAVGLLTIEITSYHKNNYQKMQNYAKKLANALQLINILRDIKEDLSIGRIYIPRELMARFNVSPSQLDKKPDLQTIQLLTHFGEYAEQLHKQAIDTLPMEDRYKQRSGLIMANIYLAILAKIKQQNYPVLQQHIKIHPLKKLWVAWKTVRNEASLKQKNSDY